MNFIKWTEDVAQFKLPMYDELPDVPLYLDQVIYYVNHSLVGLFGENTNIVTGSMINNYVKLKMMPAPIKKRYYRDHIAYIITITFLKQVISITNIVEGIEEVKKVYGKQKAYDIFATIVSKEINMVTQLMTQEEIIINNKNYETDAVIIPMKAACISVIAKIFAEKRLNMIKEGGLSHE